MLTTYEAGVLEDLVLGLLLAPQVGKSVDDHTEDEVEHNNDDNEIEELGNYYHMKSGFSLKSLDASSNLIRSLRKLSLPPSLERVILNRNAIRQMDDNTFEDKPYLSRVELSSNEINHMKLKTLSVGKLSETQGNLDI